jgi:DNA replication factor GINS
MADLSNEPMTFDDLTAIYRVERKASTLTAVRRDLYPSMSNYIISLTTDYKKLLSIDPDSLTCEGANQRRKKAKQLSKEIVEMRVQKICKLALMNAMGAQTVIDQLTSEEKEYYSAVADVSRRHLNILSRFSGEKKFDTPAIDSLPEVKPTAEEPELDMVDEPDPPVISRPKELPVEIPYEPEPEMDDPFMDDFPPEIPPKEEIIDDDAAFIIKKPMVASKTEPEIVHRNANEDEFILLRVLEDLEEFVGPDRDYKLSKEEIVRMPKSMADILIMREKAVAIHPAD